MFFRLILTIPLVTVFSLFFLDYAWCASGTVTITSPSQLPYYTTTNFSISGSYVLTEDSTPSGYTADGTYPCAAGQGVYLMPCAWSDVQGLGTYAVLHYKIDGNEGSQGEAIWGSGTVNPIGRIQSFSFPINIGGLDTTVEHTVTVYFRDIWGAACAGWAYFAWAEGDTFGEQTFRFRIGVPQCVDGNTQMCTTTGPAGIQCPGVQTCSGGQWGTCQTDPSCQCSEGQTQACVTSAGCAGTQNCSGDKWGVCHMLDPCCSDCDPCCKEKQGGNGNHNRIIGGGK
jgi:hypothetical protein